MVIGVLSLELRIPGNRSLKGKRAVVSRIKARLRNRFNVAVAEVGDNDVWGRAVIGVSTVSTDTGHAHGILTGVVKLVDAMGTVEILDYSIDML